MEQKQLEEETGPPPKQRRKTTVTSQSKARGRGGRNKLWVGDDKEDTLKQFEKLEKDAQGNKKFKQTIKEHATDEEMLARDDEADTFHSFGSMADHHWKSIKTF